MVPPPSARSQPHCGSGRSPDRAGPVHSCGNVCAFPEQCPFPKDQRSQPNTMLLTRTLVSLLAVAAASAQSVLPPFDTTYQILNLGPIPSVGNYGGTAFLPSNPNVLLVAP